MLIAIYYIIKNEVTFSDLGRDYYTKFNTQSKVDYHIINLKKLGLVVLVSSFSHSCLPCLLLGIGIHNNDITGGVTVVGDIVR